MKGGGIKTYKRRKSSKVTGNSKKFSSNFSRTRSSKTEFRVDLMKLTKLALSKQLRGMYDNIQKLNGSSQD